MCKFGPEWAERGRDGFGCTHELATKLWFIVFNMAKMFFVFKRLCMVEMVFIGEIV